MDKSISRIMVFVFIFWCASISHALESSSQDLGELLKGIKKATGMCAKADLMANKEIVPPPFVILPDHRCSISFGSAIDLLRRSDAVALDLRPAHVFFAFHARAALNVTEVDLKTKPYWRDKDVILIGDGKDEMALLGLCSELQTLNYRSVRVLHGGMPVWLANEAPTDGQIPDHASLLFLEPVDVWRESKNTHNLLLMHQHFSGLRNEMPQAKFLNDTSVSGVKIKIDEWVKAKIKPGGSVLIMLNNVPAGGNLLEIRKLYPALSIKFYIGSIEEYRRALDVQKAVWSAYSSGPKQLGCGL